MSYANHPNAALIDEVIAHVRAHPHRWDAARDVAYAADRGAAWDAARDAARDAAWDAALEADQDAAWDAAWDAARFAAWDADLGAGWGAVCALVAYPEEAAALLRQDPDVVRMVASTGNHAAVLLLPATIAMASNP